MGTSGANAFIHHLRRTVLVRDGECRTDGQLLDSFIDQKDEAAFETLVRRHGPMVLGVCQRIVRNHHDAEDAFQTTFLVLARKASSVMPRQMVANWLHGVAYRTAIKAKAQTAKRQMREKHVIEMPEPEVTTNDHPHDLRPLLDQELRGLPETYRLPILLCDLEGKSIKEATLHLGCPQGTLAGRLVRGRRLLAKRLSQRGVVLSGGMLAEMLSENAISACIPPLLLALTVKAGSFLMAGQATAKGMVSTHVTELMEGVMMSMMLTKYKTVMAALVVLGMFAFGGGLLTRPTAAQEVEAEKSSAEGGTTGTPEAPEKAPAPRKASDKQKSERPSGKSPLTPSYVVEPPDVLQVKAVGLPRNLPFGEIQCVVRPDGTIPLGTYGSVHVAGRTLAQIRAAITAYLAIYAGTYTKVEVQVDVIGYNSKCYYVIATGKENETVLRLHDTGGDTVVAAVLHAGLAENAIKGRVFVRTSPSADILEVDWRAITQEGKTETNYVLQAGDRVYVESPVSK
ncbi:MAG TPA: sigma-70 family RNA polymerase sigma factor [Gemmata sp.]|nr:sigma-70 family RNA polymerase sigma factor [Gemmata sp.]